MFAHGLPPPCAGIIAFRRVRKVRMFFVNAAARLLNQTNMVDSTQASLGVRQTDQEMMWFELMHGPAAKQPYLLELPEEYYCPAAPGTVQSLKTTSASLETASTQRGASKEAPFQRQTASRSEEKPMALQHFRKRIRRGPRQGSKIKTSIFKIRLT